MLSLARRGADWTANTLGHPCLANFTLLPSRWVLVYNTSPHLCPCASLPLSHRSWQLILFNFDVNIVSGEKVLTSINNEIRLILNCDNEISWFVMVQNLLLFNNIHLLLFNNIHNLIWIFIAINRYVDVVTWMKDEFISRTRALLELLLLEIIHLIYQDGTFRRLIMLSPICREWVVFVFHSSRLMFFFLF